MKIKAVIFDIDGVIITNGYSFSEHLQKYYLGNTDDMQEFFSGEFRETSVGKKDLKEILKPRLENWNWKLGVDKFLDFWFLSEAKTDKKILDLAKVLRGKGIVCGIASNQEKYRRDFLLNDIGLEKQFDRKYFSCDFQVAKPNQEYFQNIILDLDLQPEEILVIDDDEANVESAKKLGMSGIVYRNFKSIENNAEFVKEFGIF